MGITLRKAADGTMSALCGTMPLHSLYAPRTEAARFAQAADCPFAPAYVLVTEPGLSYVREPLGAKFAGARLIAVRYCRDFVAYDGGFWAVLHVDSPEPLSQQLFRLLGEEGILRTLFLAWKPSERAFAAQNAAAWQEIKKAVKKAMDVLATREWFSLRWARNAVRFCRFTQNIAIPQRTDMQTVVCASGPSLMRSLGALARNRGSMFLIAVSSAVAQLCHAGILPDLIVSTDGGFWAKPHLAPCLQQARGVPVALTAEAACPAPLLAGGPIVPLAYGDGIGQTLLDGCGYPALPAERNGTVSGTAARLALMLTTGTVYCAGLDLCTDAATGHAEPNRNEERDSLCDRRLCPKETRHTPGHFGSPALGIYRDWFATADFGGRLCRVSDGAYAQRIGSIPDVGWDDFERTAHAGTVTFTTQHLEADPQDRARLLRRIIQEHQHTAAWQQDALPAKTVVLERSRGTSGEQAAQDALTAAMQDFCATLMRTTGERP